MEASNPAVSKSTIEAAAGDLKESAVTRATTNAVADAQNVPQATKRAVEALPDTLRADLQDLKSNPGNLGQDAVNRIEEQTNSLITRLSDVVQNVQKVERLPDVMSSETAIRAIYEGMKDTYKGLKNSILDITRPYKESVSNTYLADMKLGNNDGSYFKSRDVAENFIKFHGLRDAEIVEGVSPAGTKNSLKIKKLDKDIEDLQKIIAENQAQLGKHPELAPGKTRYYHGTVYKDASEFTGKTFVTPHHDYAKNYRGNDNNVLYADFTKEEAKQRGLWHDLEDGFNDWPIDGAIDDGRKILKPLENDAAEQFEINSGVLEKLQIQRADAIGAQANQLATVEQQGLGYYVKITKPINETDDFIRNFIAKTKNTSIPDGPVTRFVNSWLGKYRTPEEVLSLAERQNRLTTTYAPCGILRHHER
jgi:hypothetical protein